MIRFLIVACTLLAANSYNLNAPSSRAQFIKTCAAVTPAFLLTPPLPANAEDLPQYLRTANANTELLTDCDLPRDYVRSYLQYRLIMQTSFDYLQFKVKPLLKNPETWPQIVGSFSSENARAGQGSGGTYFDRNIVNPFRIIGLSAPPDLEGLRETERDYDVSVTKLGKLISGRGGDSPVEVTKADVKGVMEEYDRGEKLLNTWVKILNDSLPVKELQAPGPGYKRSEKAYVFQEKRRRECQNRGGPTLSRTWGALMVTGTVKDMCGEVGEVEFFYQ
ncbi:hypothetical protein TrLO_g9060 [Triparma laevis f. longispina]|uniref:Uncharacterized protein n=1 Tax=Triparma laevis f. longispina TaxID=1714387 RepID=A0A9W7FTL2_9STRA|nr:hypothetical protein TrLO_g9060 [Triparma laevis f. longispina]